MAIKAKTKEVTIDPYEGISIWQNIKYSTIWSTWSSMMCFVCIAIVITFLDKRTTINLGIAPTMLTVLGTVLGFCISYRTSSAYERFIEGRKLWQQVQVATRTTSRLIWFHCPNYTQLDIEDADLRDRDAARALLEKKTMLNLLEAFAVALKHYLRGETGIHYEDLYHLVLFLPKYQLPNATPIRRSDIPNPTSNHTHSRRDPLSRSASCGIGANEGDESMATTEDGKLQPSSGFTSGTTTPFDGGLKFRTNSSAGYSGVGTSSPSDKSSNWGPRNPDKPLLPAHNPPRFNFIDDVIPVLAPIRSVFKFGRKRVESLIEAQMASDKRRLKKKKHKKEIYSGQNIPMEINLHMTNWIAALGKRKTIDATLTGKLLDANASLADALAGLERVLTTPLPFSYAIHLKHTAYIYLAFLPFQILPTLGYLTIPAVFISAYLFLGFLEIGDKIEQPLGYDSQDIPLGYFCETIQRELQEVAAMPPVDPADFIFSYLNEPLGSGDTRSALELVDERVSQQEIEESLAEGHVSKQPPSRSYTAYRASMARDEEREREHTAGSGSAGDEAREEKIAMSFLPRMMTGQTSVKSRDFV